MREYNEKKLSTIGNRRVYRNPVWWVMWLVGFINATRVEMKQKEDKTKKITRICDCAQYNCIKKKNWINE